MNKLATAALLSLGACMANHTEDMHEGGSEMQSALSSMHEENERHKAATHAARSMEEYRAEGQKHTDRMSGHMGRMRGGMMGMHCQAGPDGRSMGDAMGMMESDLGMHRKQMDAAASLQDGMAHCGAHYSRLKGSIDEMGAMMGRCSMMR